MARVAPDLACSMGRSGCIPSSRRHWRIFFSVSRCSFFRPGFFANQGALASLTEDGDVILCDRENHASIIDGCQFAPAKLVPYRHNSAVSLRNRLKRQPEEAGKLVVMDGVFSMSGDIADLRPQLEVAKEFGARVYVDEAHSLGVLGPQGRGTVHEFGMNKDVDIIMGTFSKSLGSMGGFIAGDGQMIEYLKHRARCFIFTASLAPAVAGGVLKALEIMQQETGRIEQLWRNTRKMHEGFKRIGFQIGTTETPDRPDPDRQRSQGVPVYAATLRGRRFRHSRDLSCCSLWRGNRAHKLHGNPYRAGSR